MWAHLQDNSINYRKEWNGKLTLRYRGLDYPEEPQTHLVASQSDCYG